MSFLSSPKCGRATRSVTGLAVSTGGGSLAEGGYSRRGAVAGLGAGLLLAGGGGWLGWWRWEEDALARLQRIGRVRIGYAPEAPYAFATDDGEVTGEAPEIARRMVAAAGWPAIEWRAMRFDLLLESLRTGEIDVVASGMFVTPERAKVVAFSQPTCRVDEALLVRTGNPAGLFGYEQVVARPEIRLAVLRDSVEWEMLGAMGVGAEQRVTVPDAGAGVAAVEAGLVEGLALSAPTVRWLVARMPQGLCEVAAPFDQPPAAVRHGVGYPAFAFRREDGVLREAWDEQLGSWLGSGEHQALAASFGFTEREVAGARDGWAGGAR